MVSHLQMCRRKKALGGAAPDAEQAEARAAAVTARSTQLQLSSLGVSTVLWVGCEGREWDHVVMASCDKSVPMVNI